MENNIKTIEERAKEAGVICQYKSDYKYDKNSVEYGYIKGATEQKAIDIDRACEIVRNIANEYFGDWEQSCKVEDTFRKVMEE